MKIKTKIKAGPTCETCVQVPVVPMCTGCLSEGTKS